MTWRAKEAPPGLAGIAAAQEEALAETPPTEEDGHSPIRFVWAIAAVILVIMAGVLISIAINNARSNATPTIVAEAASTNTVAIVAEVATDTPIPPTETSTVSATSTDTVAPPTAAHTATEIVAAVATTEDPTQAPPTVAPPTVAPPTVAPPATHTDTPTQAPTETLADTPTPEPSATDTHTPEPTATLTETPVPSATRPAPTQAAAPAIELVGPADGYIFTNEDTPTLSWSSSAALGTNEQFVVVIDRTPPAPNTGVWHDYHITTSSSLAVPAYLRQSTADGRFEWYVQIMRSPRVDSGTLLGIQVGDASASRTFIWPPAAPQTGGGEPGGPEPTPTRDD